MYGSIISQHILNKENQRAGMLIAMKNDNGVVHIGWSFCNNNVDTYSKNMAIHIAMNRIKTGLFILCDHYGPNEVTDFYVNNNIIPYAYEDVLNEFLKRCKKYFFNKNYAN